MQRTALRTAADTERYAAQSAVPQLAAANTDAYKLRAHSETKSSNMKLGYTIIYVPSVDSSLKFFERAFGLAQGFLHPSGDYGELKTGETTLAFASHELGEMNFPSGHVRASESKQPLGMEIAFVTEDVHAAHTSALAHGAVEVSAPTQKPWGQVVSYVRAPDGTLVELCTPVQV
jgi:lactoylglutathione lyase